ncbi:MAG TPA: cyclopropane-fatty-acyl-phospholipid synthase family protein [Solirubrobacteraceae bacterium]|nr:cyclopropane-fatty-acyl-phospholipid synthase family protein [Solirubrobacteraceae bacterium]
MALASTTEPLRAELAAALPQRPFEVRFWDGSSLRSTDGDGGPVFEAQSPRAVAHVLRAPGQLGLSRAYVSGELAVDDIDKLLDLLRDWTPPPIDAAQRRRLLLAAVRAAGIMRPPRPPAAELRPRGTRHSIERDARAVRHHYDVANEFFALFLDASMTYSCAIFADPSRDGEPLESAQERKLETICRKLALRSGERLLDVGCGWGSFAIHAAARHGADVLGITLSSPQARLARERAAAAGVADRVEIRVADYRDLDGERFDAIASIGMVEHVGDARLDEYAAALARSLVPGGRLLNHGIARLRHGASQEAGAFSERYVFPDAAPMHLSRVLLALERAGFVCEHVEGYAEHYARTLEHWAERLDSNAAEAERLAGPERMRIWRLYLRAARSGFQSGFTSIYQVRCRRP